jgi:predicted ribosome quality control (RQC) complex YloA/Tae2 family protein
MKTFSSVDLYFLTKELKALENQRIETFYYESPYFYIKIYHKGKGTIFLKTTLGTSLYLTQEKSNQSTPNSFVQHLRKYLKNAYITTIEQIESERILKITVSKKIETEKYKTYVLYIEIFPPGNVIICDENNVILNSLLQRSFKDRSLRTKQTYQLPPQKPCSLFNNYSVSTLLEHAKTSELSIVKFLAMECSLGGKYAELVLETCSISKEKLAKEITSKEFDMIHLFFQNSELSPNYIKKNNEIIDYFPFKIYSEHQKCESFSQALERYYKQFEQKAEDSFKKEYTKALKKLQNRLKKQEKEKEKREKEITELQQKGEYIYEHYALIESILNQIQEQFTTKGEEFIRKAIQENPKVSFITKFNAKEKSIEVDTEKLKNNIIKN